MLGCLRFPDDAYFALHFAATLFFMRQDQVSSYVAAALLIAVLEACLVVNFMDVCFQYTLKAKSYIWCVVLATFLFTATVPFFVLERKLLRLGNCEMLGESQSKDKKVVHFWETFWSQSL